MTLGKIIFVHGASSSGKSTIAGQLQAAIDATHLPAENVAALIAAWKQRHSPSAFERMANAVRLQPDGLPGAL
jgi:predicted kinase